jgi:hypothetical protein
MQAIILGRTELVKLLLVWLEHAPLATYRGGEALTLAFRHHRMEIAQLLHEWPRCTCRRQGWP